MKLKIDVLILNESPISLINSVLDEQLSNANKSARIIRSFRSKVKSEVLFEPLKLREVRIGVPNIKGVVIFLRVVGKKITSHSLPSGGPAVGLSAPTPWKLKENRQVTSFCT